MKLICVVALIDWNPHGADERNIDNNLRVHSFPVVRDPWDCYIGFRFYNGFCINGIGRYARVKISEVYVTKRLYLYKLGLDR